VDATHAQYTDSRRKFLTRALVRAVLRFMAPCSGFFGSMLPGCCAYQAVDAGFPPLTWYRRAARKGIAATELFANTGTVPAPKPRTARTRPPVEDLPGA
jgi:hypothetical protein